MPTFRKLRTDEIEKYGRLYFEHIKLCEDHSAILRKDSRRLALAYRRVSEEWEAAHAGSLPASARTIKEIQCHMDELSQKCKVELLLFDE